ncbi:CocE/NonD family hydrolase [Roseovarius sp. SCSIO 43702]|uniref:CocE/NonD family hydrolase n=1 Tax=Roseovarius sp. SCSIO 43702 TaxID=2823043 RepID=UPI001C72F473|nr:CocE/NonD family hydrolase [Roseovarius sp. SCSIO 43702]QYX55577.1 CocE/NonD family hydrolase [Roseovarius sp. SCSIO 43702]
MVETTETIWIEMPDGVRLAARLWRPEGVEGPVPTILEYIPYRRRDRTRLRDESMHPRFAEAGYAALRVDMRGTGDSGGIMHGEYLEQEIQDGCDVIAWIRAQDWSDGQVGMFGKSWGAYSSYQIAARRPEGLKAIAPVMGTDDRWSECIHFSGGCLMTDNFWWGAIMQLFMAQPPDPEIVGERWRDMWRARLDAAEFWPAEWLEHQTRDAFWRHGSVCEDYAAIEVPVYIFGGWADAYRNTPFRMAEHARAPVKVMIGPWGHLYPHEGAPGPQVDFPAELIRWWDHWMKGRDTGLMDEPRLRLYLQEAVPPAPIHAHREGVWVEEPCWPSPNIETRRLWLNAGTLGAEAEDGPAMEVRTPTSYGQMAGDNMSFATPGDIPGDARLDGVGALEFRDAVREGPLDILGVPRMTLSIAADKPQAQIAALLVDEAPDGAQTVITRGFANPAHREGPEQALPLTPGKAVEIAIEFHATSYRLPEGHRLMLKLSSGYWPMLWPAPEPVALTLRPGEARLDLPVRRATPDATTPRPLPVPAPAAAPAMTQLRGGSMNREVCYDAMTGRLGSRMMIDGGVFGPVGRIRLDATGTEMGDLSDRLYEIGADPSSARAVMTQEGGFAREGWRPRIETRAEMWSDAETFHLRAVTRCYDGDALFHEKEWSHEVPRNGM